MSPKVGHLFGICFLDDLAWPFKVGQTGGLRRQEAIWASSCLCYIFSWNLKNGEGESVALMPLLFVQHVSVCFEGQS